MNKYSLLIAFLSLFVGGHVLAQTNPAKEGVDNEKEETAKTEEEPEQVIKVVPAARNKNAKPAKVGSAKRPNVKPRGGRPARNPRPSSRPVRPGNGRN